MANTRGRQVVLMLTNRSGGSVAAGDVVVFDTTGDESFTTTTTGRAELSVGIAQETIASLALGRVLVSGYAALVNVPAITTRGHYLETHTVVKQGVGSATRRSGSFGQFAKASTTPSAWLWGQTDQAASGSGLGAWTTYTPTLTEVTLGNGTLLGRYKALDANTYAWYMSLVWGSTTTGTGNGITVALPATARTGGPQTCSGYILDSGTAYFAAAGKINSAAAVVGVVVAADGPTTRIATSGNPMTWATGDELVLFGTLEV